MDICETGRARDKCAKIAASEELTGTWPVRDIEAPYVLDWLVSHQRVFRGHQWAIPFLKLSSAQINFSTFYTLLNSEPLAVGASPVFWKAAPFQVLCLPALWLDWNNVGRLSGAGRGACAWAWHRSMLGRGALQASILGVPQN